MGFWDLKDRPRWFLKDKDKYIPLYCITMTQETYGFLMPTNIATLHVILNNNSPYSDQEILDIIIDDNKFSKRKSLFIISDRGGMCELICPKLLDVNKRFTAIGSNVGGVELTIKILYDKAVMMNSNDDSIKDLSE